MTIEPRYETLTFRSVFGVLIDGRSYLNALYSVVALPLGVFYFSFLVVGLSLGIGLTIIWIGIGVLLLVLALSYVFSAFERQQAIWLLGAEVGPMAPPATGDEDLWPRFKAFLLNPVTWKGIGFLFLKFPLGLFSFCFTVVSLSVSLGLLLAPFYYWFSPPDFFWWYADTLPEALLCSVFGFVGLLVSLHLLNALAWVWRNLATLMLGQLSPASPAANLLESSSSD